MIVPADKSSQTQYSTCNKRTISLFWSKQGNRAWNNVESSIITSHGQVFMVMINTKHNCEAGRNE